MKKLSLILISVLVTMGAKAQLSTEDSTGLSVDTSTSGNPGLVNESKAEEPSTEPSAPAELPADPQPEPPVVTEPPAEEPPVLEPPTPVEPPANLLPEPLPILIGEAGYGGTGCPAGQALIGHDDQGRITILLAPMLVNGNNATSFARAACSVRIPITVPENYKLAIVEVANSGQYSVEQGDSLTLTQESGFVGLDKTPQNLALIPDGNGQLDWDSSIGQLAESSCERTQSVLSLNTSALLRKKNSNPSSSHVALDSVEVQLLLEPCSVSP